ncbi:MAG: radical SAM protein [Polyangiaceae bacterium]|nr:radical SAM protein [Polyangiaceae bacterium]
MQELVARLGYVPRTCVWELTRACNLDCGHCGSMAGRPRPAELTTERALALVDELAALGTELVTFSGGEPTLRRDWPRLGRRATDLGLAVNLVTNGQTAPDALVRGARAAGLANVAVSLDGLREQHDALRGPGAFERACRTVAELASAGLWVDVMFTVLRTNRRELAAVHALAGRLGARRLRVQLGKPMGNQSERDDLTLRPADLLWLLPALGRLARAGGPEVRIGDSVGYFSAEERELRGKHCAQGHWTGCYAGCQAVGIQSDGGVKGCLSLQPRAGEADPFVEGNVSERSLRAIWEQPGAFAYNRDFDPDELAGACRRCSHAVLCRGGARCVAHAYTGSLRHDPMCYLAVARARRAERATFPASAAAAAVLALAGCGGKAVIDGGGGASGAGGDTGTTTTSSSSTIDCATVCCGCDYGVPPPPEAFQACCCEGVCCECDYGTPPPPGCCP